ncbi:MAG: DUF2203 domain-containing protein [Candidatus Omnitrophica bacterium]|nr:DUF2203 domain-containing protein [Candidatus Omnitrophota bacterium]
MLRGEGPRLFTVEEANRLLPDITEQLHHLRMIQDRLWKAEKDKAVEELSWLREDGTVSPSAQRNIELLEQRLERAGKEFEVALEQFAESGAQLKDLQSGLVDFFTARDDSLVFLCWKEGEDRIRFWHEIETGFAGCRALKEF